MKIRISGKARFDLLELYSYLAERNPTAARNVIADFDSRLRQLADFSFMGRERLELAPALRSILVRTYVVFYTVAGDEIVVMRVIDGRMDIDEEFRR